MTKLIKFIYKIILKKIKNNKEDSVTLNNVFYIMDKYDQYIILYVLICLIWLKLVHIYISTNLVENLDE